MNPSPSAPAIRNVLFIMCDQLRQDHLGCYGHPRMRTRNIDALAARSVRFEQAYATAAVCGPSRMSFYTGRHVSSHGATANLVPLSLAEPTLGDYLAAAGRRLSLVGKTHILPDHEGYARLAISDGELRERLAAGHFHELTRHDGHHAETDSHYADWLRKQGYRSADPWTDFVISGTAPDGRTVSGWNMRHAGCPARVDAAHSETAYGVGQAMRFISEQGDAPWALHLSLVKPHWPYMAPAPYHRLYGLEDCLPLQRRASELEDQHAVLAAYRAAHDESRHFMRQEVSDTVRPVYQGLIQQIDDELGKLWDLMDRQGRWSDTLVILTADHGDFLGDHWLGEKEIFYDTAIRLPFVLYDPSHAADGTRGTTNTDLVSGVDVVPTILDALALPAHAHRVEGRSLLPRVRGQRTEWRDAVVAELDYGMRGARLLLGREPGECRAWMIRTSRWKYVHWQGFRPQLFDLERDPGEFEDLGADPGSETVRQAMHRRLADWFCTLKPRVTLTDEDVARRTAAHRRAGVHFGLW